MLGGGLKEKIFPFAAISASKYKSLGIPPLKGECKMFVLIPSLLVVRLVVPTACGYMCLLIRDARTIMGAKGL